MLFFRPENTKRKTNVDRMFAKSLCDDVKNLEAYFGPDVYLYVSIDDKAKVPIGLPAANLQSPLLMHLEYKVRVNDHDFVLGTKQKLIPSVIAECNVQPDGKISYSGNTHIR